MFRRIFFSIHSAWDSNPSSCNGKVDSSVKPFPCLRAFWCLHQYLGTSHQDKDLDRPGAGKISTLASVALAAV